MARIRNDEHYSIKKEQILNKALALLAQEGYQKFSINKVIEASQMTKGAFFHYYKSKEELVYGLLERITMPVVEAVTEVANMRDIEPKAKVMKLFRAAYEAKDNQNHTICQMAKLVYLEENTVILNLFIREVMKQCLPLFESVFREGVEKGVFDFRFPHGTAFHFLGAIMSTNEAIGRALVEQDTKKINWQDLKEKVEAFDELGTKLFDLSESQSFYGMEILQLLEAQEKLNC